MYRPASGQTSTGYRQAPVMQKDFAAKHLSKVDLGTQPNTVSCLRYCEALLVQKPVPRVDFETFERCSGVNLCDVTGSASCVYRGTSLMRNSTPPLEPP